MGTWGTGISSNDTYADIYGEFIDLYNEGLSVEEITEKLIADNQETINLSEDANNFWFAIANAQWECKALDKTLFERVEKIIRNGEDLVVWKELEATPADLKQREKVLNKFLEKLQKPEDNPKKRVKNSLYSSIFRKGDCLTCLMDNGNYCGAFVLTDEIETINGINYIALTTINKSTKPSIEDFKNSDIHIRKVYKIHFEGTEMKKTLIDEPFIGGFFASVYKKHKVQLEVIGQIEVFDEYQLGLGRTVMGWGTLKSTLPNSEEYIKLNGSPKMKFRLLELIGQSDKKEVTKERKWWQKIFNIK